VKGATLALTALIAATTAFAQTTPPPTTADPPPRAAPPQESPNSTTPQSDASASPNSGNMQVLMQDCIRQVQAANPEVSASDVRKFCENEISKSTQQPED
jgi:hypothetical protein